MSNELTFSLTRSLMEYELKKDALNGEKHIEFSDIFIMLLFGAIKIKLTSK